jgi:hypothetical protein
MVEPFCLIFSYDIMASGCDPAMCSTWLAVGAFRRISHRGIGFTATFCRRVRAKGAVCSKSLRARPPTRYDGGELGSNVIAIGAGIDHRDLKILDGFLLDFRNESGNFRFGFGLGAAGQID